MRSPAAVLDTPVMDVPTDAELTALIEGAEEAARAFMLGDIDHYLEHVHHARGFTLLPPFGGPVSKHDDRRAEIRAWDGTGFTGGNTTIEHVQTHAWGDTVVLVMIERQHGRPAGGADRDLSLRVTHVYRSVDEQWQLVHRHADPLVRLHTAQEMSVLLDEQAVADGDAEPGA
jgi:ketosteroid isomerase-like protein